ncbi:MAG: hypothetical protein WKF92_02485 [Pyrinomonadaceae bacterium]
MKRPISVWIAQIFILLVSIPITIGVVLSIIGDAVFLANSGLTLFSVVISFLLLIAKVAFISVFLFAFWGLAKRRNYGRWLAVSAILFVISLSVLGQLMPVSGPIDRYEYENMAQVIGAVIGGFIIYGSFGLLIYRLAFGRNVKEFFGKVPSADSAEPPPPPVFTSV